jgi:hypothetical protein
MGVKRKKRRRPPRKVLRALTAGELMSVAEFRRWRYHAPGSLKRQAYEIIRKLIRRPEAAAHPGMTWTERVGKT